MTDIAIIVPVLGRPDAIEPLYESIVSSTTVDWQLRFMCSPVGDPAFTECAFLAGRDTRVTTRIVEWKPEGGDWARKINLAYDETGEDFILLGATDLRFHPGWDSEALEVAEGSGAGVIGTNDMGNATVMRGMHSTHPLVRRSYVEAYGTIDEPGRVLHEGYHHQWVDTELVETAKARGQWAFAFDSRVEHLHPFWHKSEMDSTYEKALSTPFEDNRLFQRRRQLIAHQTRRERAEARSRHATR